MISLIVIIKVLRGHDCRLLLFLLINSLIFENDWLLPYTVNFIFSPDFIQRSYGYHGWEQYFPQSFAIVLFLSAQIWIYCLFVIHPLIPTFPWFFYLTASDDLTLWIVCVFLVITWMPNFHETFSNCWEWHEIHYFSITSCDGVHCIHI